MTFYAFVELLRLNLVLYLSAVPVEVFSLWLYMPFLLVFTDIRQGLFYSTLLCFWVIFAGEHLMVTNYRPTDSSLDYHIIVFASRVRTRSIATVWRVTGNSSVVSSSAASASLSLRCVKGWKYFPLTFLYLLSRSQCRVTIFRGMQLRNPFYSVWATKTSANVAVSLLLKTLGITVAVQIFSHCINVPDCVPRAGRHRCVRLLLLPVLPHVQSVAQSEREEEQPARHEQTAPQVLRGSNATHTDFKCWSQVAYVCVLVCLQGIIFRFKFMIVATLVCAASTVIFFIIGQYSESHWKWGDDEVRLEHGTAFMAGVYAMWNLYVISLLVLYAPSHKDMSQRAHLGT